MKRAKERNELIPSCVIARHFDSGLDSLGPGIAEVDATPFPAGRQCCQLFGQLHHAFVVEIGTGHVQELSGLLLYGFDNPWMGVPGCNDRNPGIEIEKAISIDIFPEGSLSTF